MFYREAGQFKTSYGAELALMPIRENRIALLGLLFVAFVVIPLVADDYWLGSILTPFLVLSLAAIGLNLLMGYAGQASLGSAGFMAVGAYATYKLVTAFPDMPVLLAFFLAGVITSLVGAVFALPSLRLRAFYLAIATLGAQFFLEWLFSKVEWFSNYHPSGISSTPDIAVFGFPIETRLDKYFLVLAIVCLMAVVARNLVRSHFGRGWMSIRDHDIAAEIIGIKPHMAKLSAFAVSSFYCGVAGALWAFLYLGSIQIATFSVGLSFKILFMIIIGGFGSISGSFIGAAFIILLPIFLSNLNAMSGMAFSTEVATRLEQIIVGVLIVFFLIVEPMGLARLVSLAREKLRSWPYPYF